MKKLLKQVLHFFVSKSFFIMSICSAFFATTFIMTTALNLTKSVYDSQIKLNQDGNVGNLAIKALDNMDTEIIPKKIINQENYHIFLQGKTLQFNLNSIDINIYKTFNTYLEKINFLNMFPYERKDLLTHKEKKRIYNDFENLDKYLSYSAGQLNFNGKRNPNDLTKYAYAMLFFNLDNYTILTDPRNLVFDYDEKNNNWNFRGYWNEGNMLNEIRMYIIQMQYYNENLTSNTSANQSYLSLYKEVNKNGNSQSDFVLNTISIDAGANIINVKLRDPTYELHRDFWLSDTFYKYFKKLRIVKDNYDIPNDKYEPYLQVVPGFKFDFDFKNKNIVDEEFLNFLNIYYPTSDLSNFSLILDPYNLFGMNIESFESLSNQEKIDIFNQINISLNQYARNLGIKWNQAKKEWINWILTSYLDSNNNINWTLDSNYFLNGSNQNEQFLITPRTNDKVNNLIIKQGVDFKYSQNKNDHHFYNSPILNELIKILNVLNNINNIDINPLFYLILPSSINNKNKLISQIKKLTSLVIQKIDKLYLQKNDVDIILRELHNFSPWIQLCYIIFNDSFNVTSNDPFNSVINFHINSNLTNLWVDSSVYLTNISNFFVIINDNFFKRNKKASLPTNNNENITIDGKPFTLFTVDNMLKNNGYDFTDIDKINTYIKNLPDKYKINILGHDFIIIGSAISADYSYPIVNIQSPIPDGKTQGILYFTKHQYENILNYLDVNNFNYNYIIKATNKEEFSRKFNLFFKNFINLTSPNNLNTINNLQATTSEFIKKIIFIFSIFISIFLLIILCFVSYMVLNILIDKLGKIISIVRINGIGNLKISLMIALPLMLLNSIFGGLAYLLTFFVAPYILNSLNNIWFIPLSVSFNPFLFIFSIIGPAILCLVIVLSIVYFSHRKPAIEKINDIDNSKGFFVKGLRANWYKISPFFKWGTNLFFSRLFNILILTFFIVASFSTCSAILATDVNLNNANYYNLQNNSYTVALDLKSPQENVGLYQNVKYQDLGLTNINSECNVAQYLLNNADPYFPLINFEYLVKNNNDMQFHWIDQNTWNNNNEYKINGVQNKAIKLRINHKIINQEGLDTNELIKNDKTFLFAIRDKDGNVKDFDNATPNIQPRFYLNMTLPSFSYYVRMRDKYSLLFFNAITSAFILDINLSIGNTWRDFVQKLLPTEMFSKMNHNLVAFKKKIYNNPFYHNKFKTFLKNSNNIDENKLEIDGEKVVYIPPNGSQTEMRLSDDFLMFIGQILGDENLNDVNVKLVSGNVIPLSNDDETYTYVLSDTINNINNQIKIMGLNPKSKYIKLHNVDNKMIDLNLLQNNEVVVNRGFAKKFNLKKGDKIKIKPSNDYFNSSIKIIKELHFDSKNDSSYSPYIELKINDISIDPFGEKIYTSQMNANKMIHLDKGEFISGIYDNAMKSSFYSSVQFEKPTQDYIPFNGILSNKNSLIMNNKALLLTSSNGFYSLSFSISELHSPDFNPDVFAMLYATRNEELLNKIGFQDNVKEKNYLSFCDVVKKNFPSSQKISRWMINNLDDKQMTVNLANIEQKVIINQLFEHSIYLVDTICLIILMICLPIVILCIAAYIFGIINLIKKQISVLYLLGYKKTKITKNIFFFLFLPIILVSYFLSFILMFPLMLMQQNVLFYISSIFISLNINFVIIISQLSILIILLIIAMISIWLILKNNKYALIIKQ